MIGNRLTPIKFWCQKVLPTVYDDSLSYYEVLNKVTEFLNQVIEQMNTLTENVEDYEENLTGEWDTYKTELTAEWTAYRDELTAVWEQYKTYIDNYFDNLNVQEEINNKLDEMASDGTLDDLLLPYFNTYKNEINQIVATQNGKITVLEGRMDEFASLTEGSTTGDAELMDIRVSANGVTYASAGDSVRAQVSDIQDSMITLLSINQDHDGYVKTNGTTQDGSGTGFYYTDMIPVNFKRLLVYGITQQYSGTYLINFYKNTAFSSASLINYYRPTTNDGALYFVDVPSNANYMSISYGTADWSDIHIGYISTSGRPYAELNACEYVPISLGTLIANEYINNNGGNQSASGFTRTDLIPLNYTRLFRIGQCNIYSGFKTVAFFGAPSNITISLSFLGNYTFDTSKFIEEIPIPEGTEYFVLSTDSTDAFQHITLVGMGTEMPLIHNFKTINDIMSVLTLSDISSVDTIQIKLIGDSITAGFGGTGYDASEAGGGEHIYDSYYSNIHGHCWANSLKTYFESMFNCVVKNWGTTGRDSTNIYQHLSDLIEADDDIVICSIGTNDRRDVDDNYDTGWGAPKTTRLIQDNLQGIYTYCKRNGKEIIFISPIPATDTSESGKALHCNQIDFAFYQFANANKMEYISMYKLLLEYCSNHGITLASILDGSGLHPTDTGYDIMFYLISNALGVGTTVDNSMLPE